MLYWNTNGLLYSTRNMYDDTSKGVTILSIYSQPRASDFPLNTNQPIKPIDSQKAINTTKDKTHFSPQTSFHWHFQSNNQDISIFVGGAKPLAGLTASSSGLIKSEKGHKIIPLEDNVCQGQPADEASIESTYTWTLQINYRCCKPPCTPAGSGCKVLVIALSSLMWMFNIQPPAIHCIVW